MLSEEGRPEELLANRLNNNPGDFAMIPKETAGAGTLLLQRGFLFSWAF